MSLKEAVESGKFLVTVELAPPKGADVSKLQKVAEPLIGKVDGANITDNQRSVMRLSPLSACHLLGDWGLEPIMQLTCRDKNRLGLQSELLSAWALGVKNVVAMTGDHPTMGDHPSAKPVFDLDSVQLVHTMKTLNEGQDLSGNELTGKTDFFIGAIANPGADPLAPQMIKLRKKIAAGAQFIQTQVVYDIDSFKEFMKQVDPGVKVLAGITPIRNLRMAQFMNANVPGIHVPDSLMARIEAAEKPTEEGIKIACELIEQLHGVCAGVHLMAIGMESRIPAILEAAGLSR